MRSLTEKSKHIVLAFFIPKSCPFCPFLQGYNIDINKRKGKFDGKNGRKTKEGGR
jgi:hypothetical protein